MVEAPSRPADMDAAMTRWMFVDWVVTLGPFIVLAAIAAISVHQQRRRL